MTRFQAPIRRAAVGALCLLTSSVAPAAAALVRVGAPFAVSDPTPCVDGGGRLEVIAAPNGSFDVFWVEEPLDVLIVRSRHFAADLTPSPVRDLLEEQDYVIGWDFVGRFAGGAQVLANVFDLSDLEDIGEGYRWRLDTEGELAAGPIPLDAPGYRLAAPSEDDASLRVRAERPVFVTSQCASDAGLLARRLTFDGLADGPEHRITARASAASADTQIAMDPSEGGGMLVAWQTCHRFQGVVVRRLDAEGAVVGKPVDLRLPAPSVNFVDRVLALAAGPASADFAAATLTYDQARGTRLFVGAAANGTVYGPSRLTTPLPVNVLGGFSGSPSGHYLLAYDADRPPHEHRLYAQDLDARGRRSGAALAIASAADVIRSAADRLPNDRWILVWREVTGSDDSCIERVVGQVIARAP